MGDLSREPSMEEILSSIRRVIARDEDARSGAAGPDPSATDDGGEDDDVLELTGEASLGTATDDADEITGLVDSHVSAQAETPPATVTEPLMSSASEQASRHSLDALSAALSSGRSGEDVSPPEAAGDVTINAMVESLLRPMLRQWLDSNLPPLVERLVAREIARITGNRL